MKKNRGVWLSSHEGSLYTGLPEELLLEFAESGRILAITAAGGIRYNRYDLDAMIFRKADERVQSRGVHHTLKLKNSII